MFLVIVVCLFSGDFFISDLSNLDAGEVVGIVIGCVVAVFLLVLAFYCFYVKPDESASHYGVDSVRHC